MLIVQKSVDGRIEMAALTLTVEIKRFLFEDWNRGIGETVLADRLTSVVVTSLTDETDDDITERPVTSDTVTFVVADADVTECTLFYKHSKVCCGN